MSSDLAPGADVPGEAPDVDLIAEVVVGVPGVHDLHAGVIGEVATYLPGRRVNGIRLREPGCEIHVVLDYGVGIGETSERVRSAVRPLVPGPIDVTVEDIAAPGLTADSAAPTR